MSELLKILLVVFLTSCGQTNLSSANANLKRVNPSAKTISTRFTIPSGYKREVYEKNTFQYYLSNFPLKSIDAKVYYYNGKPKPNSDVYASVLNIDVGTRDLQQCFIY